MTVPRWILCVVHSAVWLGVGRYLHAGHLLWVGVQTSAVGICSKAWHLYQQEWGDKGNVRVAHFIEHAQSCVGSSHHLTSPPESFMLEVLWYLQKHQWSLLFHSLNCSRCLPAWCALNLWVWHNPEMLCYWWSSLYGRIVSESLG